MNSIVQGNHYQKSVPTCDNQEINTLGTKMWYKKISKKQK